MGRVDSDPETSAMAPAPGSSPLGKDACTFWTSIIVHLQIQLKETKIKALDVGWTCGKDYGEERVTPTLSSSRRGTVTKSGHFKGTGITTLRKNFRAIRQ